MTPPTDLRAALRDAAEMLESYSEIGFYSDAAKARAKVAEFRALADAPSTVAELLPRVDATHAVEWTATTGERMRIRLDDSGRVPIFRVECSILGPDAVTPPAERCPTCDREGCPKLLPAEHTEECRSDCPRCAAIDDCNAHRVDWRARAIAAEARIATVAAEIEHDVGVKRSHDHGRATGGQTCGTGGPLTGAPQSMLRYLDRVVRDLHDERTRTIADHAAQWAKVAPLIERLREARDAIDLGVGGRDRFCVAALAILAATEATP